MLATDNFADIEIKMSVRYNSSIVTVIHVLFQVSYNVTMRYQTAAGLTRLFNKSYTSHLPSNGPYSTFGIPLYSTYSTYVIQVTAVIDDGRMITSRDFTLSESEFNNLQAGQNGRLGIMHLEWSPSCVFFLVVYRYHVLSIGTGVNRSPNYT